MAYREMALRHLEYGDKLSPERKIRQQQTGNSRHAASRGCESKHERNLYQKNHLQIDQHQLAELTADLLVARTTVRND